MLSGKTFYRICAYALAICVYPAFFYPAFADHKNIEMPVVPTVLVGSKAVAVVYPDATILSATAVGFTGAVTFKWKQISKTPATNGDAILTQPNPLYGNEIVDGTDVGIYVFRVTATDSKGSSAFEDVTVIVKSTPNKAPVVKLPSNFSSSVTLSNYNLIGTISDPLDSVNYEWSQDPTNPVQLTLPSKESFYWNETTHIDTLVLNGLTGGTYIFKLSATDEYGLNTTKQITINVAIVANNPPVVNPGTTPQNITLPINTATFVGTATDPDGDNIVKYVWEQVSGPSTATKTISGASTLIASDLIVGTYVFKLTATDSKSADGYALASVVVNPRANTNPAITVKDVEITLPLDSLILTASATDAENDPLNYTWKKVSGGSLTDSASINESVFAPNFIKRKFSLKHLIEGVYVFGVTVTDDHGGSAYAEIKVTVNPKGNTAPILTTTSTINLYLPADSVTLSASAVDSEGDPISYVWTKTSGAGLATTDSSSALVNSAYNIILKNLKLGVYTFKITACDNKNLCNSKDVTVNVLEKPNHNPIVKLSNDTTIIWPANQIVINSTASDEDGDVLTYEWQIVSTTTPDWAPEDNDRQCSMKGMVTGDYVVKLTVKDGKGGQATAQMKVTVSLGDLSSVLKPGKIVSPNGDNQHPTWEVENIILYPELSVLIINEQGQVVYTAKSYRNEWDGRKNGKDLPEGAYFYMIRDTKDNVVKKGSFVLIR